MCHLKRSAVPVMLAWTLLLSFVSGASVAGPDFLDAKTVFQTNAGYDSRIAIAADGVIVHRHGGSFAQELASWREKGFTVGRMFFADSDAANAYWTGRWDGTPHPNDVERNQAGEVVKCAGVRPYMLPTDGWIRYLEEMADQSLAAGADAILPEEPLAHVFTGYEKSFRELWAKRYDKPWAPQHSSAEARFLTAQLKNELYIELERRLSDRTGRFGRSRGRDIGFVLPIHSLYSNIAAQLVAPLGTSVGTPGVDGYIGQIWTGPVNWALGCYDSPRKSFFTSAYVLYDYFTQLTVASDRKLWLLVDPVEDNPDHTWAAFAQWYKHCIAAMLLMDEVDSYEIMPWPDRIFLPGHSTGGSTPAPEDYRVTILAVTQALQEVPLGGTRFQSAWPAGADSAPVPGRIGVAMADTLMWQKHEHPMLQGVYAMFLPLLERGIPVSSFVMERAGEAAYMSRFDTIVLSYEDFKPVDPAMHAALLGWVKCGGVLLVLGRDGDALDACEDFWWRQRGFDSPLQHLLSELETPPSRAGQWPVGSGWVIRDEISPKRFADPKVAQAKYLNLIERALSKAGGAPPEETGSFCMQRGPFIVAHAETKGLSLRGRLLDIFDPELSLTESVELQPGDSGLFRDVAPLMEGKNPALLHATHRVVSSECQDGVLTFTLRGPAETPGVARVFFPEAESAHITATHVDGHLVDVTTHASGDTILVKFPNAPEGVTVVVK